MFIFSKYIYKLIFWLYTQLHVNYLTLDKTPKFLGFTVIDIGLFVSAITFALLALILLFKFTKFKTAFAFGVLACLLFFMASYSNQYTNDSIAKRYDIVKKIYPKLVNMKTDNSDDTETLKLNDTLSVKNFDKDYIEVYDSYKKSSRVYIIDTVKYVDEDGKTVKVSKDNYGAFDEKASEIIKTTKHNTKLYYFKESLVYKDNHTSKSKYTVVFKFNDEQVKKAKELEKQTNKDKKISENSEKFFNE